MLTTYLMFNRSLCEVELGKMFDWLIVVSSHFLLILLCVITKSIPGLSVTVMWPFHPSQWCWVRIIWDNLSYPDPALLHHCTPEVMWELWYGDQSSLGGTYNNTTIIIINDAETGGKYLLELVRKYIYIKVTIYLALIQEWGKIVDDR